MRVVRLAVQTFGNFVRDLGTNRGRDPESQEHGVERVRPEDKMSKIKVQRYFVEVHAARGFLSIYENSRFRADAYAGRQLKKTKEERFRVVCGKKILEDGFRLKSSAETALQNNWTLDGLVSRHARAQAEHFERIRTSNEKFDEEVSDLNKQRHRLLKLTRCR